MKEVWEVQKPLDRVIHTMGWPLKFAAKYREFGGSFIYPMGEDKVSMGLVVGLDYRDARFSVHDALPGAEERTRWWRRSSRAASGSAGARRRSRRAATGRSRGSCGRPAWRSCGDGAGMVNVPTLKGVHYAMHAGMFAAEAIYERLKAGGDCDDLSNYQEKVEGSEIEKDRYRSRNMRQPFAKGFFVGGALASMMEHLGRARPGRPLGHARRRHGAASSSVRSASTRSPTAR